MIQSFRDNRLPTPPTVYIIHTRTRLSPLPAKIDTYLIHPSVNRPRFVCTLPMTFHARSCTIQPITSSTIDAHQWHGLLAYLVLWPVTFSYGLLPYFFLWLASVPYPRSFTLPNLVLFALSTSGVSPSLLLASLLCAHLESCPTSSAYVFFKPCTKSLPYTCCRHHAHFTPTSRLPTPTSRLSTSSSCLSTPSSRFSMSSWYHILSLRL